MRAELSSDAAITWVYWDDAGAASANGMRWQLSSGQMDDANAGTSGCGLESLRARIQSQQNTAGPTPTFATAPIKTIMAIVPAEAVLITTVNVPSSKRQHILAAVPHLVEEWCAADIDTLHIALGERTSDGDIPVAAIDHDHLSNWLSTLDATGLRCEQVWVDALLLPYTPGTLTLVIDQQRALLRWSEHHGGSIDLTSLDVVIAALLRQHNLHRIAAWATTANDETGEWLRATYTRLRNEFAITMEQHRIDTGLLGFLIQYGQNANAPLNLRQGDFAPAETYLAWQRWRPAALVASVCLVVFIAVNGIGGLILDHRATVLREQNEARYRELFPQDKRLVNVAQQFRTHIASITVGGQAVFFTLFGQLATGMQAQATEPPLQLRTLLFDATTGALQVELIAPNVQAVDTLQKQLSTQHLRAKVLSAANDKGVLMGRLSITESGP